MGIRAGWGGRMGWPVFFVAGPRGGQKAGPAPPGQTPPTCPGTNAAPPILTFTLTPPFTHTQQSELREWLTSPPDGCSLEPTPSGEPSLTEWVIRMDGPPGSVFAGESFRLRARFSPDYPLEPPEIVFVSPVPAHEHIYSNGHCCLDTLYTGRDGGYSPALTISKLTLALQSMLASATEKRRPEGDAEYCKRTAGRSPKQTVFVYDDDRV